MTQVLRQLPALRDPRLLVGTAAADDAGVYRLRPNLALVQTVDFFTPIVDDPSLYGQIAAANALSDVYAMGGRPLTALNIVGMPTDQVPPRIIREILRGGALKVKEAGCALVGGHSIKNPEPIYGLAITGLVHPRRMITNAAARPGDFLILTKPVGTGIIATGIKRNLSSTALAQKAVRAMCHLNTVGATLAERGLVRAGTDVTGFGLLGHLGALCRASGVGAVLHTPNLPIIDPAVWDLIAQDCIPGGTRQNLASASAWTTFAPNVLDSQKQLLADAQTSGGLLLCIHPQHVDAVQRALRLARSPAAAVIGWIVASSKPRIWVAGQGP